MKSRTRVRVALGQGLLEVGELVFEEDGTRQSSMFRYSDSWLERPNRFALAPSLPLLETPFYASGHRSSRRSALPGPVADATPDSWGRGIIRKAMGRQPSEVEFLLKTDDLTRQGALRFLDEAGTPLSQDVPSVPRLTDLDALAHLTRLYERDPGLGHEALRRLIADAGSLGGARPKANFADAGTLSIAKFTSERDTMPVERMEVATLQLARACGIDAATARIEMRSTNAPVAIIARFDRRAAAGGREGAAPGRIHMVSAQSFLGAEEATGGYYTDLADQIRAYGADPGRQMEELHRRIMFTILVSNNDDHLKNHALLYAGENKWALAPAFDINPQPERHRHLETGISELSGFEASVEAAVEAAPFFDVTPDRARANLGHLVSTIEAEWQGYARDAGMSASEVAAYRGAFEHDETARARALIAPRVAMGPVPAPAPAPVAAPSVRIEEALEMDGAMAEAERALGAVGLGRKSAVTSLLSGPPGQAGREDGAIHAGPTRPGGGASEPLEVGGLQGADGRESEQLAQVARAKQALWAQALDRARVTLGMAERALQGEADAAGAADVGTRAQAAAAARGAFAELRERVGAVRSTLGAGHAVTEAMTHEWREALLAHPRAQEAALQDARSQAEAAGRVAEADLREEHARRPSRPTPASGFGGPSGP